ncbi:MAG: peptidase U32 family protein [Planctomycetota bacterium]|jgi:putative protease
MSDPKPTVTVNAVSTEERPTRVVTDKLLTIPELLAPAGSIESFYAAMQYGADAVYLGLRKFSARDNAVNFTPEQLNQAVGYAHEHGRKVYVTINTIVQESEWPELIQDLALCEEIAVDAVILQDMGVLHAIREQFPRMTWHASTQMLIHNPEGAKWAERNGFERAILARELTLDEIRAINDSTNIELETFIHGSLCYSYSGLCLFASQEEGRSGNRGKCTYICRDTFKTPTGDGKAFSMRDLMAPAEIKALRESGIKSLKIEGRRKGPLYTAAVVDLYRKLLDGTEVDVEEVAERLKNIYSRETTTLFLHQSHGDTKVQADIDESEPQGVLLGKVTRRANERVEFKTETEFERHDGILAKVDDGLRFGADRINLNGKRIFKAEAGDVVSIVAPDEVVVGTELRLTSSNATKRLYPVDVPKKVSISTLPVHLQVTLRVNPDAGPLDELGMPGLIEIVGRVYTEEHKNTFPCKLLFADKQPLDEERLKSFFERLGRTRFTLKSFSAIVPAGVFIPAGEINDARREFFTELDKVVSAARELHIEVARKAICEPPEPAENHPPTRFSATVDRMSHLEALPMEHFEEVAIDVANITQKELLEIYEKYGDQARFAAPIIVRSWTAPAVRAKLQTLHQAGARKFQVSNIGGFEMLANACRISTKRKMHTTLLVRRSRNINPRSGVAIYEPDLPEFSQAGIDVSTDWPCYTMSRETARSWLEQGASRITLSIEDGKENLNAVLSEFANVAEVIVYHDTPLFTAETCIHANMLGHCPGKADCDFTSSEITAPNGHKYVAVDKFCQTLVLNSEAYSLSQHLRELEKMGAFRFRLCFENREYTAEEIKSVCEQVMNAQTIPNTHHGNWDRGLQ